MGVDTYVDALQKKYKDSFIIFGSSPKLNIERISTGSLTLDATLGGGLPKGKMVVFWGQEMSGKTTTALLCLKGVEKGLYVDVEKSYDPEWAKKLGLDIDNLIVARPSSGEVALSIVADALQKEFDVVVIDSVAALVPSLELNKGLEESMVVAAQARLINYGIRRLNLMNKNTCLIFVNQVREKIGVMYGSPEKMPGGRAIYFVPHVRLKFRKGGWLPRDKKEAKRMGIEVRVMVEKNKFGESQRDVHFDLYWAGYIDQIEEKARLMLDSGEIIQEGAWYSWGKKKVHGKDLLLELLKSSG